MSINYLFTNSHYVHSVIKQYIQNHNDLEGTPSLKFFFDKYMKEVATYTDLRTDVKRTWAKRYKEACKSMHIESCGDVSIRDMGTRLLWFVFILNNLLLG